MSNTAILIAVLVALLAIVAIVLLLRKPPKSEAPRAPRQAAEGQGLADEAAAALLDVSAPLLGIDLHPDLPSDDLTRIKGLGPKAAGILKSIGIHRYAQLADLDPAQAAEVDLRMGAFQGRIGRDHWVEQARLLENNDIAAFEAKFGKLG